MTETAYDGLPTLATEAFEGRIPEQFTPITEADLLDAQVEADLADREDWTDPDEDGRYDPDFEAMAGNDEPDERLAWGGMDVPS